jgi:hypothetical protein
VQERQDETYTTTAKPAETLITLGEKPKRGPDGFYPRVCRNPHHKHQPYRVRRVSPVKFKPREKDWAGFRKYGVRYKD